MPPVRRNWLRAVGAATAIAVATGGCGAVEHATDGTLDVALTEYRIVPRTLTATPGLVRIDVRNDGRLTHNLVIKLGGHVQGSTASIPPGTESTVVLILGPGLYTVSSTMLEDADLGARATLRVN